MRDGLWTGVELVAAVLVAVGFGLMFVPAGLVAAGVLALAFSWVANR